MLRGAGKGEDMRTHYDNRLPEGITIYENSFGEFVAVQNESIVQFNGKNVSASNSLENAVQYFLKKETNRKAYLGA